MNLSSLAHDVIETAGSTHPSRQIRKDLQKDVRVPGEKTALRQVLANLVMNALVHTPPSSEVTVRLVSEKDQAVFDVADKGPGMTAEDAADAFDRFWRAETSRTRCRLWVRPIHRPGDRHRAWRVDRTSKQ